MEILWTSLMALRPADVFDILFLALILYGVLVWFKRTRSAFVLTGIVIVGIFYVLIRQFNLVLTTALFERFFAVLLIALVVIFQEELRYFFEQIAVWSLNRRRAWRKAPPLLREEVEVIGRTLTDMSKERIGALVVLKGNDLILRHLHGGYELGGRVSEPLLKSIFDPHSLGHDGAAIVEGNRLTSFATHLPLSKNVAKLGKFGTRHAAALGLSELSDALCMVVSEQSGVISAARDGEIVPVVGPENLFALLDNFYSEMSPRHGDRLWHDFLRKNWREKTISLVAALFLWIALVGTKGDF